MKLTLLNKSKDEKTYVLEFSKKWIFIGLDHDPDGKTLYIHTKRRKGVE